MFGFSKPIRKGDDAVKDVIMQALAGRNTHGFDIDSIYYNKGMGGWIVIEFLKCDTVRPHQSHPRRYWNKNWRKFASLWTITKALRGKLYLVNYEDSRAQFSIINVTEMVPTETGGIVSEERNDCDQKGFDSWYQNLNDSATEPW